MSGPLLGIRSLERALTNLRRAIRVHLIVQRGAWLIAVVLAATLAMGLIDYMLRLPMPLRLVLWVLGAGAVTWTLRRTIWPIARFNPSLTDLAIRVEDSDLGHKHGWRGLLASGLELARTPDAPMTSSLQRDLARASSEIASARFLAGGFNIPGLLENARLRRALGQLVVVFAVIAALDLWQPALVGIGTQRVLTPWTGTAWPKRTGIAAAPAPSAHALGTVFPLRAILTRSPRSAEQTRVVVNYRVIAPSGVSEVQRALLTPQGKRASLAPEHTLGAPALQGHLFEQLLDTQRLADLVPSSAPQEFDLEYWFETSDDQTSPLRVHMVEPPRVASASIVVTPPEYARPLASAAGLLAGTKDVGEGLDTSAAIGPILAGSGVELHLTLTKDIPVPGAEASADDLHAFVTALAPELANVPDLSAECTARSLTFRFPARQSIHASFTLIDAYSIPSRDPAVYRLTVVDDRPASAAVIDPAQDESVLATAVIPATGEGRDDLGLAWVSLRSQIAKVDPTSVGAAPEPAGSPAEVAHATPAELAPSGTGAASSADQNGSTVKATTSLELADLNLHAGDEVWLTTVAADVLAVRAEDAAHGEVTSSVRRLHIISESELVEQFRGELASLRDAARQMEQDQSHLIEQRAEDPAGQKAGEQSQRQGTIAQRLDPVQKAIERLTQRADRNRLEDESLKGLLQDAAAASESAAAAAQQASQALKEQTQTQDAKRRESLSNETAEQQSRAADELSQLADMLSQGEDDWAVRRSLERLLTEQRQVRAQSAAAGEKTQGKDAKDLTREERDDLDRLARKQQELSQRAAQALDQLEQRAQQMQETDPAQARAMQQSAARARQKQLVQKQNEAGQRLRQNQTGQAQQSQKQAEEALQDALDTLDQAQKAQDEQLKRVLADVTESLRALVQQQESELHKLAQAQGGQAVLALDRGMISLHQNTLGVLQKVRTEAKNADGLANLIDGAQQAQSSAVSVLRADAPDLADADEMERVSLSRLKDALAEAEKAAKDADKREQDRVRRELRKQYQELVELEVALKAETDPFIAAEVTRRTRQQLREVARKQDDLRTRMNDLRAQSKDLAEAKVFDYAHTRFDKAATDASKDLAAGQPTKSVQRQQAAAVAILQSLVEALKESKNKDDELQDDQGGGGGGGGGGGSQQKAAIPPLSELILLRGMQAEAAARTRALSDQGADATELSEVTQLQDELTKQGADLLKRLQQQGPTMVPPQPAPKQGENAGDKPADAPKPDAQDLKPDDGQAPEGSGT